MIVYIVWLYEPSDDGSMNTASIAAMFVNGDNARKWAKKFIAGSENEDWGIEEFRTGPPAGCAPVESDTTRTKHNTR